VDVHEGDRVIVSSTLVDGDVDLAVEQKMQ